METDRLEDISIGNTVQSIRIRGADASNPLLLLIQQGPGLPMINEARRFERLLGLEQGFTVVYWDQRGCGRSRPAPRDLSEITVSDMTDDAILLLEVLRDRFGGRSYVAGFSLGATVAARAAARRPDLFATVVLVGADIDGVAAASHAYDFALGTARRRGERRAIRQLESIGPPPHLTLKQFSTRVRWVVNFGGTTVNETYATLARGLVASLLGSPAYSIPDVVRTFRGMTEAQDALLAELATLDLAAAVPELAVPVVMIQGRLDQVAPDEAAQRYADALQAPSKQLLWFESSAHTPHLDEPARYREVFMQLRGADVTQL
jgi:pimeloyl-ACP methyl ester carboxylesterase